MSLVDYKKNYGYGYGAYLSDAELEFLVLRRPSFYKKRIPIPIHEPESDYITYLKYNWKIECNKEKNYTCENYDQYLQEEIKHLRNVKEKTRSNINNLSIEKVVHVTGKKVVNIGKNLTRSLRLNSRTNMTSRRGGRTTRQKTRKHRKRRHLPKK